MHHVKKQLEVIAEQVEVGIKTVDLEALITEKAVLDEQINRPDFWDDSTKAQEISKSAAVLGEEIKKMGSNENGC